MSNTPPTVEQVKAEPPGEQLDRWVAVFVMGVLPREVRIRGSTNFVTVHSDNPFISDGVCTDDDLRRYGGPPPYSTEIEVAWLVVEKMAQGEYVKVRCSLSHYHGDHCTVTAADPSQRGDADIVRRDATGIWGETMSHAICRAALIVCLPEPA